MWRAHHSRSPPISDDVRPAPDISQDQPLIGDRARSCPSLSPDALVRSSRHEFRRPLDRRDPARSGRRRCRAPRLRCRLALGLRPGARKRDRPGPARACATRPAHIAWNWTLDRRAPAGSCSVPGLPAASERLPSGSASLPSSKTNRFPGSRRLGSASAASRPSSSIGSAPSRSTRFRRAGRGGNHLRALKMAFRVRREGLDLAEVVIIVGQPIGRPVFEPNMSSMPARPGAASCQWVRYSARLTSSICIHGGWPRRQR